MTNREKEEGKYSKIRQQFLLTFFDDKSEYQEKEVNGFWLVKSFNGNTGKWQVAIYRQKSFEHYKNYQKIIQGRLMEEKLESGDGNLFNFIKELWIS